ncbi:hypothetical protein AGMMS49959_14280 [Planctomycetales bacterium]|nr:hypothetical protein AGMMS49959_14280 [Planctomycetales bacterium]
MKGNFFTRMLLMLAIFMTAMYFMNMITPPPAATETATDQTPPTLTNAPAAPSAQSASANAAPPPAAAATVYDHIVVRRDQFVATFTTRGGALKNYQLTQFFDRPANEEREPLTLIAEMAPEATSLKLTRAVLPPVNGVGAVLEFGNDNWQLVAAPKDCGFDGIEATDEQLIFAAVRGDLRVRHIYDFSPVVADGKNNFGFRHWFVFENLGDAPFRVNSLEIAGAAGIVPDDRDRNFGLLKAVSGYYTGKNSVSREENDNGDFASKAEFSHPQPRTAWSGFTNRFFASFLLVAPAQAEHTLAAKFTRLNVAEEFLAAHPRWQDLFRDHPQQGRASLVVAGFSLPPRSATKREFLYYGGPLDDDIAAKFSPAIDDIATFSWAFLKPISNLLLFVLEYIAVVTRNYGWAIVLLTVAVKATLHPLTRKSMKAQKGMQKIQPLLKEIKEKYKNNPQKQQQETVRIFKENGVNPVGGCLPILLQMPIFFALYGVFARCFAVRQEAFIPGWIDDLSHPDTLYTVHNVPILGALNLNPLPLLYLALQFIHMSMMPKSADPQMQSQQRIMKLMPIAFVFIFYNMPSGLVLYFAVQSLLTIVEYLMMKVTKEDEPTITDGGVKIVDAKVVPAGKGFKRGK